MATLLNLAAQGALSKIDVDLGYRVQELRLIYALPRLEKWLTDVLPTMVSTWQIEVSPLEQLDALLEVYASGDVLTYDHQVKPLKHKVGGIWELKTADVRIFGWFPSKDCFIGSAGADATAVKNQSLYSGYINQASHDRQTLNLDPPKYIPGEDPNDVISNFSFP